MNTPPLDLKIHPIGKLAALVEQLAEEGVRPSRALAGSGLNEEEWRRPRTRASYRQLLAVMRNAMRLARDPGIALRAGRRVHVTSYGLYGYALLSSGTAREAFEFAVRYHRLATPLVHMVFEEDANSPTVRWRLEPLFRVPQDDPLYRFVLEFQVAVHLTLHRDVLGLRFRLDHVDFAFGRPPHGSAYRQALGCRVYFHRAGNEIHFDRRWLDRAPTFAHSITHAATRELCDDALGAVKPKGGLAGQVAQVLRQSPGRFLSVEEVAVQLHVTVRTLHRKLAAEGASYKSIRDDLRRTLALRYLRETEITVSDIADRLAYSDAAAFRHAVRRWTGSAPTEVRLTGIQRA